MPTNKQDLSQWKNTVLNFNAQRYNYQLVLQAAASCPLVDVDIESIKGLIGADNAFLKEDDAVWRELLIYKHDNETFIVAGSGQIQTAKNNKQTTIKARLLSKQALKKARIAEPVAAVAAPVPAARVVAQRAPYQAPATQRNVRNSRYN